MAKGPTEAKGLAPVSMAHAMLLEHAGDGEDLVFMSTKTTSL